MAGETLLELPGPAHRGGRRLGRARPAHGRAVGGSGQPRRLRRRPRPVHGPRRRRSRGPGGVHHRRGGPGPDRRWSRCGGRRRNGSRNRWPACREARPPGRRWPPSCCPGSTCCCSTNPPTTSTSPGSTCSSSSWTGSPARCWWCRTTGPSSIAASTASSSSTTTPTAPASSPAAGPTTPRPATWPGRQQSEAHEQYVSRARPAASSANARRQQWSERGVKRAKTSGEPDKSLRASHRERSEKQAGKVKATERELACPTVDKPWEGWRLELSLAATARSGDVVVRLDQAVIEAAGTGISVGRRCGVGPGDEAPGFRLGPIDLEVAWQDRLAILGANGSGKSTLLAALLGEAAAGVGSALDRPGRADRRDGPGPRAVRRRRRRCWPPSRTSTDLPISESRSLLAKFGLGPDHLGRAGHDLSPGERTRAQLGRAHGQRRQLPGARRAHQPPRHRGHRAARAGPRRVRRHAAAGVPRPPLPRRGRPSPGPSSSDEGSGDGSHRRASRSSPERAERGGSPLDRRSRAQAAAMASSDSDQHRPRAHVGGPGLALALARSSGSAPWPG